MTAGLKPKITVNLVASLVCSGIVIITAAVKVASAIMQPNVPRTMNAGD